MKDRLLWVGDAVAGSGFGKATKHITRKLANDFDITAVGINYRGDPHDEPYQIWPAWPFGDPMGLGALRKVYPEVMPSVVVFQTNPWFVPRYLKVLDRFDIKPKTVGIIAVEGRNCVGKDLNGLDRAIFWTDFGLREAQLGGYGGDYGIQGLGVDREVYKPGDRTAARRKLQLPERCMDAFIVSDVNRNQNRKRPDLAVQFFMHFLAKTQADAYLYMHAVPGSSTQCDIDQIADYYGVQDRLILPAFKDVFTGHPEEYVVAVYQSSDVHINPGLGEGWGLTTLESMACGIPNVATDYAAIPEWGGEGVWLVPPCSEGLMPDVHTMLGGTPDREQFVDALVKLYEDPATRAIFGRAALNVASRSEFDWGVVADGFAREIKEAL